MRTLPPLTVVLAKPRGYCAGVERALEIVNQVLERTGPPVFVRHDIVHNVHVLRELQSRGVRFVDDLSMVPEGTAIIFSAHGVPPEVVREARERRLFVVDATCPLVSKVHAEVADHSRRDRHVILVGHASHVEVLGTAGYAQADRMHVVETLEDAEQLDLPAGCEVALATQTTLSVDDTAGIMAALRRRFPGAHEPAKADLCYATQNRQAAVKMLALATDAVVIVGGPNSSNATRLFEAATRIGSAKCVLLASPSDLEWHWLNGVRSVGVTSAASTPEYLVEELVASMQSHFEVSLEEIEATAEAVQFRSPPIWLGHEESEAESSRLGGG